MVFLMLTVLGILLMFSMVAIYAACKLAGKADKIADTILSKTEACSEDRPQREPQSRRRASILHGI